jgi:hypothetical protein
VFDAIIAALTTEFGEGAIGRDEFRNLRSISIPGTDLSVNFAEYGAGWTVTRDKEELFPRRNFNEASPANIVAAVKEALAA